MAGSIWTVIAGVALTLLSGAALAQGPQPKQPAPQQAAPQAQPQQAAPPVIWERMPHMQLEAEYAGPMKDTAIQRWRDPTGDIVCYLYIPFTAQHSPPTASGYVQYGANTIGSISCLQVHPPAVAAAPAAPARTPAQAAASKAKAPAPAPRTTENQ
jgi:hypothetical protein